MTSQNFSFTSGELYADNYTLAVDDNYGSSGSNGVWRWDIMAGGTRYVAGTDWSLEYTQSSGIWRVKKPNESVSAARSQTAVNGVVTFPEESTGTGSLCTFSESAAWQTAPSSSSGPTVTSITVNESTQFVTVLHTGTLTSSDINYNISNVNSSITNLQSTINGSTFTASGSNGTHVIQIGGKIATYYIYNTTSGRTTFSNTNNLVVSFPTTDNAWLSNFSAYNSGTITEVRYFDTKTSVMFAKDASKNYYVFVTFNLNYNSSQAGFSVLTQIYDYRTSSAPNWNYAYGSTLQWVYPEATFESTGSANTLITLPTNEIVASVNWNFASVVASETTTSNGGGKPDRYPLIMTNLFNRNRSLYSIGMTHKDTWDLFL